MDWIKLPKVELHLHLDCSLSYKVVSQINPSITFEQYREDFIAPEKCQHLSDYLTRALRFYPLMQTTENLHMVTLDLFEQIRKDGVIYAEIRFAPMLHTNQGLSASEVIAAVEAATAEAARSTGIEARIILCTLRYYSTEQSLATVKLVESFRDSYVAGFDIAAETHGDVIDAHLPAFLYAREKEIPFTAHAGETRGIKNVWETVRNFAPSRIGHGVSSIGDPELLEYLRQHQIHLEGCPTCNIQTNCYNTYADHPIDKLYRAGISIGVNTDTRTISNITLSQEYQKLNETFGWESEDFHKVNRNALKAAFVPEDVKKTLLKKLDYGYQQSF